MRAYARLIGSPQHREHWSLLVESVKSGKAIFPQLRGKDAFEYLRDEPELGEALQRRHDRRRRLAGDRCRCRLQLQSLPHDRRCRRRARGAAIHHLGGNTDRAGRALRPPEVVAEASALLRQRGVEDRVRVEGGSFFDSVPSGGDAYVLKTVIHDWPDGWPSRSSSTFAQPPAPMRRCYWWRRCSLSMTPTSRVSGWTWRCCWKQMAVNATSRSTETCSDKPDFG